MKVVLVVGARPNFMKAAALVPAFVAAGIEVIVVNTGQHGNSEMSSQIFKELKMFPTVHMSPAAGDIPVHRLAHMTRQLGEYFGHSLIGAKRPDFVVVVGDCDSTLAGALAAKKCGLRLAHVESGLRCFDRKMQEEINRIAIDHVSDLLFTSEPGAWENLDGEGVPCGNVYEVGNVMIDTLKRELPNALKQATWMNDSWGAPTPYALLTLHRAETVDDVEKLKQAMTAITPVAKEMRVVFPVHPRTKLKLEGILGSECVQEHGSNVICRQPMGYFDFISCLHGATLVMTDSGGVQEEATALGVPCLTLRPNTERPSTVLFGTNRIVELSAAEIEKSLVQIMQKKWKTGRGPELWDGKAAERVAEVLLEREKS